MMKKIFSVILHCSLSSTIIILSERFYGFISYLLSYTEILMMYVFKIRYTYEAVII